jgi:hypothetical protein
MPSRLYVGNLAYSVANGDLEKPSSRARRAVGGGRVLLLNIAEVSFNRRYGVDFVLIALTISAGESPRAISRA